MILKSLHILFMVNVTRAVNRIKLSPLIFLSFSDGHKCCFVFMIFDFINFKYIVT